MEGKSIDEGLTEAKTYVAHFSSIDIEKLAGFHAESLSRSSLLSETLTVEQIAEKLGIGLSDYDRGLQSKIINTNFSFTINGNNYWVLWRQGRISSSRICLGDEEQEGLTFRPKYNLTLLYTPDSDFKPPVLNP